MKDNEVRCICGRHKISPDEMANLVQFKETLKRCLDKQNEEFKKQLDGILVILKGYNCGKHLKLVKHIERLRD